MYTVWNKSKERWPFFLNDDKKKFGSPKTKNSTGIRKWIKFTNTKAPVIRISVASHTILFTVLTMWNIV